MGLRIRPNTPVCTSVVVSFVSTPIRQESPISSCAVTVAAMPAVATTMPTGSGSRPRSACGRAQPAWPLADSGVSHRHRERDDEADTGEAFQQTAGADAAKAGRPGAPILQPTAPAEPVALRRSQKAPGPCRRRLSPTAGSHDRRHRQRQYINGFGSRSLPQRRVDRFGLRCESPAPGTSVASAPAAQATPAPPAARPLNLDSRARSRGQFAASTPANTSPAPVVSTALTAGAGDELAVGADVGPRTPRVTTK